MRILAQYDLVLSKAFDQATPEAFREALLVIKSAAFVSVFITNFRVWRGVNALQLQFLYSRFVCIRGNIGA